MGFNTLANKTGNVTNLYCGRLAFGCEKPNPAEVEKIALITPSSNSSSSVVNDMLALEKKLEEIGNSSGL